MKTADLIVPILIDLTTNDYGYTYENVKGFYAGYVN